MGNALTCHESGSWDSHGNIEAAYVPAETGIYQDMNAPLRWVG